MCVIFVHAQFDSVEQDLVLASDVSVDELNGIF